MIESFAHKGLKELFIEGKTKRIGSEFIPKCARILEKLDMASVPEDMNFAGYHFHGLQGSPKRYSVRINKNWRITFGWNNGATDIDLEDYH